MKFRMILPVALLSSLSLISCGGGGGGDDDEGITYTGSTSEATVTADNAEKLAVAATAGAGQSIAEDTARDSTGFRSSSQQAFLQDFAERLRIYITTDNRTANQDASADFCSSGSADFTSNQDGTDVTIVFNNCVVLGGDGEVVSGKIIFKTDAEVTFFSIQFINFAATYEGETYTINMTMTCNDFGCNWSSDFTGPDGRTYRTVDADISFDGSSYSVTATVFDPEFGFVTINADVTYNNCPGGVPETGSITFTGSGTSGSITFVDCNSFIVIDDDGLSTPYDWADFLS